MPEFLLENALMPSYPATPPKENTRTEKKRLPPWEAHIEFPNKFRLKWLFAREQVDLDSSGEAPNFPEALVYRL